MGSLQYISSERPDRLGKIATCMEALNNIEEQTWAAVDKANIVLQEIKDTNKKSKNWYPVFGTTPPSADFVPNFKLLVVTDSAFKNL